MPSQCPQCQSPNIYQDSLLWICPECGHEWTFDAAESESSNDTAMDNGSIVDANGTILADGDDVVVLKELKIKGAASAVKGGTKVKKIRLLRDGVDGHNISCKIEGIGSIFLKSEYVRKA